MMTRKCANCGAKLPDGYSLNFCKKCINASDSTDNQTDNGEKQDSEDVYTEVKPKSKTKPKPKEKPNKKDVYVGPNEVPITCRIPQSMYDDLKQTVNDQSISEYVRELLIDKLISTQ